MLVKLLMRMSDSIVLPCDSPDWSDMKQKLTEARNVARSSFQELITHLQKISASVATSSRVHDCVGARPKTWNIYADLKHCLDDKLAVEERESYLTRILLHVVDRAIDLEVHRSSEDILACRHNRGMTLIRDGQGCSLYYGYSLI